MVLKQIRNETTNYGRSNIDPRAFVIMDDCLYDNTWSRDKVMRLLFMNGRHWKMLFILSLQYCMDVKPVIRTNVDGCFILRETNLKNRKSLWG